MSKTGKLSINSENMLPIIKKWLYSDHDIFVREQVANACDAITKLRKLEGVGEFRPETPVEYEVHVEVDPDEKTLKFIDNGIGMTEDEVERYITQIAFSGANEFLKKYEGKTDKDQIIGHFGLGFYSAFMVADEVHIDTLSYQEGATPVHWESDGVSEYRIGKGERETFGTTITLFLNSDCYEFCNEYRVREVLEKYCSFMPTPIYLADTSKSAAKRAEEEDKRREERNEKNKKDAIDRAVKAAQKAAETAEKLAEAKANAAEAAAAVEALAEDAPEEEKFAANAAKTAADENLETAVKEDEDARISAFAGMTEDEARAKAEADFVPEKKAEPKPINDIHPLWAKRASECTDEEYKDFFRKVFNDYKEPLFWIHLNTEFPFNLRGILYFPKINTEYDALESQIKLYNNQVFIADNIKEVIPDFLMTLKGVIDCPDLPLNVSRSALQNDGTVKKICDYISKKVADKLTGMCKTKREDYEKVWDDIAPFIKYGCIKDDKFADKMMDAMLFKDLDDKHLTLKEYAEKNAIAMEEEKAEDPETVKTEDGEVDTVTGNEVVDEDGEKEPEKSTVYYVTDEVQQAQYIAMFRKAGKDAVILKERIDQPFITKLEQQNKTLKFARIDTEVAGDFAEGEVAKEDADAFIEAFRKALDMEQLDVKVENMKDEDVAAIMTLSEENRRMQDMMKMYGMGADMYGGQETLVLNAGHPLVKYVRENVDSANAPLIARQLYDLAMLSHKPLSQEEMTAFVKRSNQIMELLAK